MPARKRLKRRFGKDHERPIMSRPTTEKYRINYAKIDWSKKDEKKK